MALDARTRKYGLLIGIGAIAGAAVVFFGMVWPPSKGTEGAIGQRQVYRDGTVHASDVKVQPGRAPVAIKAFLQSKKFHAAAKKRGFTEVDSKEFTALTEDPQFINFLATPGLRTFARNPLLPKVIQTLRATPGKPVTMPQLESALGADAKTPAYALLVKNTSFQRWLEHPVGAEVLANPVFVKFLEHPVLTASVAIVQPHGLNDSLADSLTDNLADSLTDSLADSLGDNLGDSLADSLTDSLDNSGH